MKTNAYVVCLLAAARIEANPEHYDQCEWSGTTCCRAGHIAYVISGDATNWSVVTYDALGLTARDRPWFQVWTKSFFTLGRYYQLAIDDLFKWDPIDALQGAKGLRDFAIAYRTTLEGIPVDIRLQ